MGHSHVDDDLIAIAAALRTAADQVTSEFYDPPRKDGDRYAEGMADGKILRNGDIRAKLLAIAAELEGANA
jgi:hypothetical protein